jgi:hypothetical protein
MLKVVSLILEAKGGMKFHVIEHCRHGRRDCGNCRNDVSWAGGNQVGIAKYAVLSRIISSDKLLCNV